MENGELARLHKALSVPVRLEILRVIAERPLCVNAITRFLRISQPAVSQHLAVLRHAGLVRGDKSGYRVHYSLNQARLQELRTAIESFPGESPPAPGRADPKTRASIPRTATSEAEPGQRARP